MSTFDHKKNKNNLSNHPGSINNAKPKSQEEIAKEFLPTNGQENRMSNAFATLKSQQNSQEEIAKEFLPTNEQTSRMSNAFASLKSQHNSQQD